ncbi:CCA tRNA nucleotidyltransferase [Hugenholtzia roseola]|uniref:CCA tRNA nucleotidyltransferase n=1 Tax=Hugenholtzia roseola TaxID=1002 RepID=UPI000415CF55|nr:HD domain-containing protein [Hugenholtzia roseola]
MEERDYSEYKAFLSKNPIFERISRCAAELKMPAYVIGGYVRDFFLGRKKAKQDIDIVCVGSGIELAKALAKTFKPAPQVAIFKRFGTAMLKIDDIELEFVGARKESYDFDSRKPTVENGSLTDDQNRRDFTINALALSLQKEEFGKLLDPFGGLADLRRKIIRTPLDADITFSDDPLRMMRAIRFAAQLNFDIEADTFAAISKNKERISIVSQERVTTELNKIIETQKPSYGFNLLFESGLLALIFPQMALLHGVESIDGKAHKDNFYHTLKVLDNTAQVSDDLWLRWAAILHDIAKPQTKRFDKKAGWTFHGHEERGARLVPKIFRDLRLPLDQKMRFVQKLVRLHLRPIALVKETITDSAIRRLLFEAGEDIDALMKLCRADITSKDHNRVKRYLQNFDKVEKKMAEVEQKDRLRNFQPVVDGELIMTTFGIKPSREVGLIKTEIREAILEGIIRNEYDEAYAFMLAEGKKLGLTPIESAKKA